MYGLHALDQATDLPGSTTVGRIDGEGVIPHRSVVVQDRTLEGRAMPDSRTPLFGPFSRVREKVPRRGG